MTTETNAVEIRDTKAFALVSHDGRLYHVSAFTGRCKDFVPVVIVPGERYAELLVRYEQSQADVARLTGELATCREILRHTRQQLREAGIR